MNPETKITEDQLKELCASHGLDYHSSTRITVGFSHEVHKLNNDMIIKIYRKYSDDRFQTELAVLKSKQKFPKPEVIAFSNSKNLINQNYIIMSFVEGKNLGAHWHITTDMQREAIIEQLSSILRNINKINPSMLPSPHGSRWDEILMNKANDLSSKLFANNIISSDEKLATLQLFKSYLPVLNTSKLYPVNWDVHFDNLIIDDDFNIRAIIDLENVQIAALDFPLFVIKDMVNEPHRYMTEENEKFANKSDYMKLWGWYQRYYPEMFDFANLEQRVKAYELLNILHLMQDWSHDEQLIAKFNRFIN